MRVSSPSLSRFSRFKGGELTHAPPQARSCASTHARALTAPHARFAPHGICRDLLMPTLGYYYYY